MNQNNNFYFSTTSLSLATAIYSLGISNLEKIEWIDRQASFYFPQSDKLNKVIDLFWQKRLPVDAMTYFTALKFIKSRMYEQGTYGKK